MVLNSTSVLSCLLHSRRSHGSNHGPESRTSIQKKSPNDRRVPHDRLGDPDSDPFQGNPLQIYPDTDQIPHPNHSLPRANTVPAPPPLIIPNGGIGESPSPVHRSLAPPVRSKRSSFTTFFAFSSKRRSSHGVPIIHIPHLQQDHLAPPQAVPGRWVSVGGQEQAHLINPATIPSPLRTDEEEFYYSYYAPLTPTFPSQPASPYPDATNVSPSKRLSARQQDLIGNPDLDSHFSSPIDSCPSHTQIRHPYSYSTPLHLRPHPQSVDAVPPLCHIVSQPLQHLPQSSHPDVNDGIAQKIPSSHLGHEAPNNHLHLPEPHLRASVSTPNLPSRANPARLRSFLRRKPLTGSKKQEQWLSAETWWDALFSPSPRFKVRQAPRLTPAADSIVNHPVSKPIQAEPNRSLGVTFPSAPAARPRAVSVTAPTPKAVPTHPVLSRSRSVADLNGQPSTSAAPHASFEPPVAPLPDQVPDNDSELPSRDPPLSLEQVLDEVEAFEQQRAQWKEQAYKSLGNKQIRSFSRARSKSLGERHARLGHRTAENGKAQMNLEFLAARTLLGSQSMMPVVHVTKPSNSSTHSKACSHSHSQSAHSYSHSSPSRAHSHSHSHSHSLTTSNSSKSSRNLQQRGHFRNGSWGKTLLKAGSLCGFGQDESYTADDNMPSSSRVDVQGIVHPGGSNNVADVAKASPSPRGEVGIAISSSPPPEGDLDTFGRRHRDVDQESRWSSRHTHKSSEYAGPHPSAIDSNLPQLSGASDVSLRHRLPPRATIHPPIAPIVHPYRSATTRSESVGSKGSKTTMAFDKVAEGQEVSRPSTGGAPLPHVSFSPSDVERYGVGQVLVYASLPRPGLVLETKGADVQSQSSPTAELPSPQEQSPLGETSAVQSERRDSAVNSAPSVTNSTIQMVVSAFDNPDDLDEFQDLFYKPQSASGSQHQETGVTINQMSSDIHDPTPSSPLTHLVRKLSEEVNGRENPSRTPSDPISLQRSESQDHPSSERRTDLVFMDLARVSSSPPPAGSSSQLRVPIGEDSESTAQSVMVIPEDVSSSYTSPDLEIPLEDRDNDTFGYPIKHGQLEAVTHPTPIQSPMRLSTHLSIQEDAADEDDASFLSPLTKRYGLASIDAVRASYLTTSDMSQMSGLSDFPLPPSSRPMSIVQAYVEASADHGLSGDDETEMEHANRLADGGEDGEPPGDVQETLRALRMVPNYENRRSTFGGSDDMDFITRLHQADP